MTRENIGYLSRVLIAIWFLIYALIGFGLAIPPLTLAFVALFIFIAIIAAG